VENLKDWRWEGVIYRRDQDPSNADDTLQLWAPDVTRGPDGKYYLYYCLSFLPEIGVAVSDSPAGPFAFYGHVKYPDSTLGGKKLQEFMPFDPAVLTDDDGRVYLYYGFAPAGEKEMPKKALWKGREVVFGEDGMAVELEPDMLTMKDTPHVCVPGGHHTEGTSF
ncbi:MAG: family 43 glycosylhydrolase, partial [Candidatus Limivivens sp.]|nr:family 43 glycosylhydrolase [Candidatus Limivivens sp.]